MILDIIIASKKALRCFAVAFFSFNTLFAQMPLAVSEVNSPMDELHPVIHPSGDMYFSRALYPENAPINEKVDGIWKSSLGSGQEFSAPVKVNEFSTPYYDLLVGFPDHQTAFVFHHQYEGDQGIFVYKMKDDLWQMDSMLSIPGLRSMGPKFSARLSQDGKILLMSMQSYGSYGNEDLYVSKWNAITNTWSSPFNLGSTINSSYQELTPYFSEKDNILFFSSNRPGEGSGFQLFFSLRLDESFSQWSTPEPLSFLDSDGVTLSYLEYPADGSAFFTSTSSSEGYADIFRISPEIKREIYNAVFTNLPETTQKLQTPAIGPVSTMLEDLPIPESNTTPQKQDPKLPTDLEKKQTWISEAAEHLAEYSLRGVSSTGEVGLVDGLLPNDSIETTWILSVPGYIPHTIDWGQPFSKGLLIPVKPGMRMDLSVIQFERSSSQLSNATSIGYIKAFADFMIATPSVKIGLEGHTDNLGNVELNKTLSTQRASHIRDLLVNYGVDYERVRVSGFGGTRPKADNNAEAGRILNRRVELVILEN